MDLDPDQEEDAEMTLHSGDVQAAKQLTHQNAGAPAKADAQKMTATKLVAAKAPALLARPAVPACKAPGVPASGCPGDAAAQLAELQRQLGTDMLLQLLQSNPGGLPEAKSPPLQRAVFSPGSPPVTALKSPELPASSKAAGAVPALAVAEPRSSEVVAEPKADATSADAPCPDGEGSDAFDLSHKDFLRC